MYMYQAKIITKIIILGSLNNRSYLHVVSSLILRSRPRGNHVLRFGHQCQILIVSNDWMPFTL